MEKPTAIDWFLKELENNDWYWLPESIKNEIINQAKEMEKKQIIDACNLQRNDYKGMPTYNKSGEQYYNETFKSE
jgi:hypothetical protein